MSSNSTAVFFYGLFMDESLLETKGITPSSSAIGHIDGYRLRIGKRATLLPDPNGRAYGVLMTITRDEAKALYDEPSVADYVPEAVTVTLSDGPTERAVCYNLPASQLAGTNPAYAESLYSLAQTLGFPQTYLDVIRAEGKLT